MREKKYWIRKKTRYRQGTKKQHITDRKTNWSAKQIRHKYI